LKIKLFTIASITQIIAKNRQLKRSNGKMILQFVPGIAILFFYCFFHCCQFIKFIFYLVTQTRELMNKAQIAVIGAGPAGIAAALQLNKYDIKPMIFEREVTGGLMLNAWKITNYPGFPNGISGYELASLFEEQLFVNRNIIHHTEVISVDYFENRFHIYTNEKLHFADFVIYAAGTVPKKPTNIKIHKDAVHKVLYDISAVKSCSNKRILVVGAGNYAFDYAVNLSQNNKVILVNKSDKIKCSHNLLLAFNNQKNIGYLHDTVISEIIPKSENILVSIKTNNLLKYLLADFVLYAIGREQNLGILSDSLLKQKEILTKEKKIFFVGDVRHNISRQVAVSTGEGIRAAVELYEKIRDN
jgi:thioredoxin reductase (NADPH)